MLQFQVILSIDYGIHKHKQTLTGLISSLNSTLTFNSTFKYLKTSVHLPTSNLGPGPHPGEHKYELVIFQVFVLYLIMAPFRHLMYPIKNRV